MSETIKACCDDSYFKAAEVRDWQTCDLIAEEHEVLLKQVKSLTEQLEKAEECCGK